MTKPIEQMTAREVLDLARSKLAALRRTSAGSMLGTNRTDDPDHPPPDPSQLQDAINVWRIVEGKAARAVYLQIPNVAFTPVEMASIRRHL